MNRISINSQLTVSRLIYGMWRLGDDANTSTDHIQAKIQSCLDQGITTFDQADIYGDYGSESLLGNALRADPGLRKHMEIITKCDIKLRGAHSPDRRVKHYDTSAAHITASIDQSLINMAVDHIDMVLIHRPDPLMNAGETAGALDAAVRAGKVSSLGVSNFRPWDWRQLQDQMKNKLVVNQIEINPLALDCFTNGDLVEIQRDGLIPQAWSPLAGGQLFADTGHGAAAHLAGLAARQGVGLDALLIAWLLHHPAQIMPVMGSNDLTRIAAFSNAFDVPMDRELWFEIYEAGLGQEVP